MMGISNCRSAMLIAMIAAFITSCHSLSYSDLEALGVNCPSKNKCGGYSNNLTYMDRSCECDRDCTAYRDCCIDALANQSTQGSRPAHQTDVRCLNYGVYEHSGVYVISRCRRNWNGDRKVREKCMRAPNDFSDPVLAAPVTDAALKKTYRNLACAECNNANLSSLTIFQIKMVCEEGLEGLTDEIEEGLTYNEQSRRWGVNRLNEFDNGTIFFGCEIIFDVPEYIHSSVRFCRSNLISNCAANWTRRSVARLCAQYTTAVYSITAGYRNPHCAICNHKTVDQISCENGLTGRRRPVSFALWLDVNQVGGKPVDIRQVSTPECPSNSIYDPFFHKCRQYLCSLPGKVVVNGQCVDG